MRALASLFVAAVLISSCLRADGPWRTSVQPSEFATPISVDRGAAAVWQSLQKLRTRASLIMITAHPDDEDGGMLTLESRGRGTRVALLTLNRGEGGANVMSSDFFDALGLVRTMELLEAGRHYGVEQYWTRLIDYGFSKTKEEALGRWTHERVLYDVVRVIRVTRPLVITSVFVGGPSDGHGNHQVAGQMAADAFRAAGDPNVFPDQIKAGLRPWKPLKYYARVPRNAQLSADVEVPVGEYNPVLGASYLQIAREGLGLQKSQNGGPSIPQAGPQSSPYHRFAPDTTSAAKEQRFFDGIDTSLAAIAANLPEARPKLAAIAALVEDAIAKFDATRPESVATQLADGLKQLNALIASTTDYEVLHELRIKQAQFQFALTACLGISVAANVAGDGPDNPFRGPPDTFRIAIPGQKLPVRLHVANQSGAAVRLARTWIETPADEKWTTSAPPAPPELKPRSAVDLRHDVTVSEAARYTRPYFARPDIEQPYYDLQDSRSLNLSLPAYPVAGWAEFEYNGVIFRAGQVVQTTRRITGPGVVAEPLVVGPAISLAVQPRTGIVPIGATSLPLTIKLKSHVKGQATGKVRLDLPAGWSSRPASADFATNADGDEQTLSFEVSPAAQIGSRTYEVVAVADYAGKQYREGFQTTGYAGLRPYFLYRPAVHKTSGVDVRIAPDLKVGYITGTGDEVPEALQNLGLKVTFLSANDLATGDLSAFDVIVLGVRAYAAREDVKTYNNRILEYANKGGVVIVQYNTPEFDKNYGPFPYVMGNNPEEVTDEASQVEILAPQNPVFNTPNKITAADFAGWVEERGSKWMQSWDTRWAPLLSTHDAGQEPQKGGLLFARYGKGVYIYNAWAFYRQLPEGVPGAYRLFANMLSLRRTGQ